jgi:hypothetical protein
MSIVLFTVVLLLIWIIVEIVSIMFKTTGMDLYKARFQTISILTHTGYTTRESELVTQHPSRRKIASGLMVISYLSQMLLISFFINILMQDTNRMVSIGLVLLVLLVFLFLLTRTKYLSTRFNGFVERIIEKRINTYTGKNPMSQVIKISPEFGIYEIIVDRDNGLDGKTLMESHLKEEFIQVLKVEKGNGTINFPTADLLLRTGDKLVVYGKVKSIKDVVMGGD